VLNFDDTKVKNMRCTISLWLGLLTIVLVPTLIQTPASAAPSGRIHGHVTNPTGEPQLDGSVSLSTDGGNTLMFTFPVSATGDYSGVAAPGTYMVVYRASYTPPGKIVDFARNVTVVEGYDVVADVDMSRQEFIDKLPESQKTQVEALKKANAEAKAANAVINRINADLRVVNEDIRDAETARTTAVKSLGASAAAADVAAKTAGIQTAKYTEIEAIMTKDIAVMPNQSILWTQLAHAEAGLKKFDFAESDYKKALALASAAGKPMLDVIAEDDAGLGEVYARQGKVLTANAAFDAAVAADPKNAASHLRNEAITFMQEKNATAQVAAADEAIKFDPNQAILYYLKGKGLLEKATIDPRTQMNVLPQECIDAYQKYLELAPDGPDAAEIAKTLQLAGQKVSSYYHAPGGNSK
jgi:tetratricopeptide (TPR) repeat protein